VELENVIASGDCALQWRLCVAVESVCGSGNCA
jgi:hypothetical protein